MIFKLNVVLQMDDANKFNIRKKWRKKISKNQLKTKTTEVCGVKLCQKSKTDANRKSTHQNTRKATTTFDEDYKYMKTCIE